MTGVTKNDVFISYSAEDRVLAEMICAFFEERSIACWMAPRDILPGVPFEEAIVDGIEGARSMVVVLSASANRSPYVKAEVNRGFSKSKTIFTVRVENILPEKGLELYLARHQWTDGFPPPLEPKIERLATAVQALTRAPLPVTIQRPQQAHAELGTLAGELRDRWGLIFQEVSIDVGGKELSEGLIDDRGWLSVRFVHPRVEDAPVPFDSDTFEQAGDITGIESRLNTFLPTVLQGSPLLELAARLCGREARQIAYTFWAEQPRCGFGFLRLDWELRNTLLAPGSPWSVVGDCVSLTLRPDSIGLTPIRRGRRVRSVKALKAFWSSALEDEISRVGTEVYSILSGTPQHLIRALPAELGSSRQVPMDRDMSWENPSIILQLHKLNTSSE